MSAASASPLQAEVDRLRLELATLQVKHESEPIEIGNYLLARLEQLKVTVSHEVAYIHPTHSSFVKKMFGVPGDFNLGFLVSWLWLRFVQDDNLMFLGFGGRPPNRRLGWKLVSSCSQTKVLDSP